MAHGGYQDRSIFTTFAVVLPTASAVSIEKRK
jgi:hypothetical protein